MIKIYVQSNFSSKKINQQLPKAIALAITRTTTDSQEAIQSELPKQFTIRGPWWKKGNKFGIKVRPAEKTSQPIHGEVGTNADWLTLHEGGGTKKRFSTSSGSPTNESFTRLVTGKSLIAIPTKAVKRTKREIIRRPSKPFNLKRAFAVQTKRGNVLIMARPGVGKKTKPVPYYLLRKTANIDNTSTVIDPTIKTFRRRFKPNFEIAMRRTMTKTAKVKV